MILLPAFIAGEMMVILSLAMYIDGRKSSPSIFIRSDILLGIVANIAVSLLLICLCGFIATAYQWWQHGVHISNLWLIVLSLAITFLILKRMSPAARLASPAVLGDVAAAA